MALRVIGVGDNVADHYLHSNMIYPGGNAFNFAAHACLLGAHAAYLGVFGDDFPASHVYNTAKKIGVSTERCRILHGENGCPKVRLQDGERIFVSSNRGGVSRERPLVLDEQDIVYLSGFDLIHTSINSYIETELAKLASIGKPISFDFSTYGQDMYFEAHCPHITYAVISCSHMNEQETLSQIQAIHHYGSPYVLATRGREGAIFSTRNQVYRNAPVLVKGRDTMGAGDAFLTAFLLLLLEKSLNIECALSEAAAYATEVCMLDGAFGHGTKYDKEGEQYTCQKI